MKSYMGLNIVNKYYVKMFKRLDFFINNKLRHPFHKVDTFIVDKHKSRPYKHHCVVDVHLPIS